MTSGQEIKVFLLVEFCSYLVHLSLRSSLLAIFSSYPVEIIRKQIPGHNHENVIFQSVNCRPLIVLLNDEGWHYKN